MARPLRLRSGLEKGGVEETQIVFLLIAVVEKHLCSRQRRQSLEGAFIFAEVPEEVVLPSHRGNSAKLLGNRRKRLLGY